MAKKKTKTAAQTVEETKETVTTETQETTTVETPVTEPVKEEITTTEPVEEKKEDTPAASEEPVVTKTSDTTTETEVPKDTTTPDTPADPTDKPTDTEIPDTNTEAPAGDTPVDPVPPATEGTETPDASDIEPADKIPTDPVPPQDPVTEPVKEEKPAVSLSSVYPVRYHITFSQKRMAFVRKMPIYNMLSTWCFNKSSFIGCTSKKDYEEIESCVKALPENKVRVEGIMLSEAAKEQFLIKLKANTDYCVLKWGDKRK